MFLSVNAVVYVRSKRRSVYDSGRRAMTAIMHLCPCPHVRVKVVGGKITETGRLGAFITKVKKGSLADVVGHLRAGASPLDILLLRWALLCSLQHFHPEGAGIIMNCRPVPCVMIDTDLTVKTLVKVGTITLSYLIQSYLFISHLILSWGCGLTLEELGEKASTIWVERPLSPHESCWLFVDRRNCKMRFRLDHHCVCRFQVTRCCSGMGNRCRGQPRKRCTTLSLNPRRSLKWK